MGDRHDPLFRIELLHQIQDVPGQDSVCAGQVVQRLDEISRTSLLLCLDGFCCDVGSVHALHAVADSADGLDGLFSLVANSVKTLGDLIRRNFLDVFVWISIYFDHQPGLGTLLFQLLDSHVRQRPGLDLVATVCRGVDHVQLLARDLVQQLLGAEQVLYQPDRVPTPEVREVRHHGEVLVGAPLVVQHDVVGHDRPADTAHKFGDDLEAVFLHEERDAVAVELLGDGAHVASLRRQEVLLAVQLAVLALNDANVAQSADLAGPFYISIALTVPEAVPNVGQAVVCVGHATASLHPEEVSVRLVVQDGNIVAGEPFRGENLAPGVRIVLIGIVVDDDVLRIQAVDADFALHAVAVLDTDVQEASGTDDAVGKHVRALPVELVVVADLAEHLCQHVCGLRRSPRTRPEADLGAVVDLLPHHVAHGGEDLVNREHRAAHRLQFLPVGGCPLVPGEKTLTFVDFLDKSGVPVVPGVRIAVPNF